MKKIVSLRGDHGENTLRSALASGHAMYYLHHFLDHKRAASNRAGRAFPLRVVDEKLKWSSNGFFFPHGSHLIDVFDPLFRAFHDYGIVSKAFR